MKLRRLQEAALSYVAGLRTRLTRRTGDRFLEERMTWIFGAPRTGSTWLAQQLLATHDRVTCWNEPYFGLVLNHQRDGKQAARRQFVLADCYRSVWQPSVARFILDNVRGRFSLAAGDRLVLKEPNSGSNADLLMDALPRARMIFLMRDPRDVLDSLMDLHRTDSWNPRPVLEGPQARRDRIHWYLDHWIFQTRIVQETFERHLPERRLMLKYEDLRRHTLREVQRVFDFIDVRVTPAWLEQTIATHAFEALPDEAKGPGKFARAASPGQWRSSFSLNERRFIQDMLGPWLDQFGYAADDHLDEGGQQLRLAA